MTHIKTKFQTTASNHGYQQIRESTEKRPPPKPRVPHITKLMALAIRLDHLLASGQVKDQAEIARVAGITRARVTQILNLTNLAPEIQRELVESASTLCVGGEIKEWQIRAIAHELNWERQRRLFRRLAGQLIPIQFES